MASTINADDGVVSGSAGVKTSADNSGVLELQSNGTTQFTLGSSSVVINEAGADVDFRVEGNGDSDLLFVDANENAVGISTGGNAVSNFKLEVVGNKAIGAARFADTFNANGYEIVSGTTNIITSYNRGTSTWLPLRQRANQHEFYCDGVEAARIDSSGNVGIGTSSPSGRLEVAAASSSDINTYLTQGSSSYHNITRWTRSSGPTLYAGVVRSTNDGNWKADTALIGTGNNFPFLFYTNDTERARITSGGDLLVGTTSNGTYGGVVSAVDIVRTTASQSALSVKNATAGQQTISVWNAVDTGTIYFVEFSDKVTRTTRGSITSNGTLTAYNTSSDRRLKENIAPADDAGEIIDSIEIVKHDWKAGGHTRYGAIAQDLHAVAPEAVTVGDNGEEVERAWGVDYSKLVPMLVKEIQSLRARLAAAGL